MVNMKGKVRGQTFNVYTMGTPESRIEKKAIYEEKIVENFSQLPKK